MTDKNSIVLGVDTLKKVLELLPQDYSVSIQINNTIFPAQTFDISDDYKEIILKWFDLDYSSSSKRIFHIDDIKKTMLDLEKENKELKQEIEALKMEIAELRESENDNYKVTDGLW